MRSFNISGPVVPEDHYCIPPLERWDLDQILALIQGKDYFVLHAPRQSGKTSALLALRDLLNSGSEGDYRCVYMNAEVGQAARENLVPAMQGILRELTSEAHEIFPDCSLVESWPGILEKNGPHGAVIEIMERWARALPVPLVLLIDEIDALAGDALISILCQLRTGYAKRPERFPQSIILCGVHDVRDCRIHSGSANEPITGGSSFNIAAKSFRLEDFSREEVAALLGQHTEETGQAFSPEALETVWTRTQGQPWLVNALARRTCFPDGQFRDFGRAVEAEDVREAEYTLILNRETHLDQLADKLHEDRVRRVIEPLLSGGDKITFTTHDLEYVRDLGLIARDDPLRIANPIYTEVVPRELTYAVQKGLTVDMVGA